MEKKKRHISLLHKVFKRDLLGALSIALILSFIWIFFLGNLKIARVGDLKLFDMFYNWSLSFSDTNEHVDDIVTVLIDDESLSNMNAKWPWSRALFAAVIKKMDSYDPAVICLDVIFAGESTNRKHDALLSNALKASQKTILSSYFGSNGKHVVPERVIAESAKSFGMVNKPRDEDNIIRRMRPYMLSIKGNIIDYSFGVKIAAFFSDKTYPEIVSEAPIRPDHTMHINFAGKKNGFRSIPAWKLFEKNMDLTFLKDKIVFLGVSSEVFHDTHYTPVGRLPGVVILANETLTYLSRNFFRYPGKTINWMILFFFTSVTLLAVFRFSLSRCFVLFASELAGFSILSTILLWNNIKIEYFGVIIIVAALMFFIYGTRYLRLILENVRWKKLAITDSLTNLYSYRYFEVCLRSLLKKSKKTGEIIALTILDIDYFKKLNDTYGHEFGNQVLKDLSGILAYNFKRTDIVVRYGGEEFCVIMQGISIDNVNNAIDRIRKKIQDAVFYTDDGKKVHITISAGICSTELSDTFEYKTFVNAADMALYRSKTSGRNTISVYDETIDT